MKLLFKQRLFSWFDSYDIYDEAGNTVYVVKGQFSWGHKLAIYDAYGNEVGMVVQKVLTFLPKFLFGELRKSEFVERFLELSLFYGLSSPLNSEMICIFPYF